MDDREDRIRRRAYELWLAAGSPDGSPEQYWLIAEQEVGGQDHTADRSQPSDDAPAEAAESAVRRE